MPETRRKPKESFEGLLRRFSKQVQQSGKILQAKKIRYYARPKSGRSKKIAALRREKIEQKKEYLRKVGKLKERFPGVKALMKM